jgi:hypothetical protein
VFLFIGGEWGEKFIKPKKKDPSFGKGFFSKLVGA